jgi:hypothetical protein
MTIDNSIKRIFDKIDDELLDLAILIDANPGKKDEILNNWMQDKQDPAGLCRQADDLYQETFEDLDGLFKTIPCLHRFKKDML